MRLKIHASSQENVELPYNYQYQLQFALYELILQNAFNYTEYVQNLGFFNPERPKLFCYSKLFFYNHKFTRRAIRNVKKISFYFSSFLSGIETRALKKIFLHKKLRMHFHNKSVYFKIIDITSEPEPEFSDKMKFTCLSPILIKDCNSCDRNKHYLNYLKNFERERYGMCQEILDTFIV